MPACGRSQGALPELQDAPAAYAGKLNPLSTRTTANAAGQYLYEQHCASCHGPAGLGDGPISASLDPAPTDLVGLVTTAPDDYLFWRVTEGMPGTSMPAWKRILTEEEIWQTLAYVRSLTTP
jgi:mono/diheme cytochrome c family protein